MSSERVFVGLVQVNDRGFDVLDELPAPCARHWAEKASELIPVDVGSQ